MEEKEEAFYEISVAPHQVDNEYVHEQILYSKFPQLKIPFGKLRLTRRSIDARKGKVQYVLRFQSIDLIPIKNGFENLIPLKEGADLKKVLVVGAGPAGYFAAFQLIQSGVKPIVVERGKDVQARRRDIRAIMQESIVNEDSNYCFGEGGAGTYSDGKLYTRSTKRGDVRQILHTFCFHGAEQSILIDANPHIGTNKLPKIIASMREAILEAGGEIHFGKKLIDFVIENDSITKGIFEDGSEIHCDAMILATGHSARDIYSLLHSKDILLEAKPFALGVRVEHPQALIDQIQYSSPERPEGLPAAPYSVVAQEEGRGVFSFCMCPGGMIVPAATQEGEIVVNGMSPSRRDSAFANSGFVTSVEIDDIPERFGKSTFSALAFQASIEKTIFNNGDGSQKAPAQRLMDFLDRKESLDLPACSYIPGIYAARLDKLLPEFITERLIKGFRTIGKKLGGYLTNDAVVVGVESRTSSPVRIPRVKELLNHPQIMNLYPCGEGAGFAGGIVSAGIDGVNVAKKAAEKVLSNE